MADELINDMTGENDPVADFLQREQDQLAGLDESFGPLGTEDIKPSSDNGITDSEEFNATAGYGVVNPTTGGELWQNVASEGAEDSVADSFSAIRMEDKQKQEPEKMRKWREEQAERLKIKDEESEKKKAEWREAAKKELQDWYKHREEMLEKTKVTNRETEETYIKDRDDKKEGAEWERACSMCDFNPKGSRNNKDVSRMRSILLQLKQSPITKA